jgi:hypothetical protein
MSYEPIPKWDDPPASIGDVTFKNELQISSNSKLVEWDHQDVGRCFV